MSNKMVRIVYRRDKMKKLLICVLMALLLTGCGAKEQADEKKPAEQTGAEQNADTTAGDSASADKAVIKDGYVFEYNGVEIRPNTDVAPVLQALGEADECFEAKSCAFDGMDKTFFYSGIELTTYPKSDKEDYVSSIYFTDDSVSTKEGIYIGSTLQQLLDAYGENYSGNGQAYTYTKEDTSIMFIVEEDEVTSITYLAAIPELQ